MTTTAALPRCPFKSCPVRYRAGPDRPCPEHEDETGIWSDRLEAMQAMQASMAATGDSGGRARRDTGHSR